MTFLIMTTAPISNEELYSAARLMQKVIKGNSVVYFFDVPTPSPYRWWVAYDYVTAHGLTYELNFIKALAYVIRELEPECKAIADYIRNITFVRD